MNRVLPESTNNSPQPQTDQDLSFDPANLERQLQQPAAGPDPFDLESLRLGQNFNATVGVKRAILSIPVRKPDKAAFVRTHPDQAYRLQTALVELKEDRESYLVARPLWDELSAEPTFRPKLLTAAITRQGALFLWEANLPKPDGRKDEWCRTALEAIDLASKSWIRITPNMAVGAYDVHIATGQLSEPEWPDMTFQEMLKIAFKDRYIMDPDHPVLRRLRGEV